MPCQNIYNRQWFNFDISLDHLFLLLLLLLVPCVCVCVCFLFHSWNLLIPFILRIRMLCSDIRLLVLFSTRGICCFSFDINLRCRYNWFIESVMAGFFGRSEGAKEREKGEGKAEWLKWKIVIFSWSGGRECRNLEWWRFMEIKKWLVDDGILFLGRRWNDMVTSTHHTTHTYSERTCQTYKLTDRNVLLSAPMGEISSTKYALWNALSFPVESIVSCDRNVFESKTYTSTRWIFVNVGFATSSFARDCT